MLQDPGLAMIPDVTAFCNPYLVHYVAFYEYDLVVCGSPHPVAAPACRRGLPCHDIRMHPAKGP